MTLLIEGRRAATSGRGAQVRLAAGVSQNELAALVGVSQAAVWRWEAGERVPRGRYAIAYARALRQLAESVVSAHG
jgi:transcriptional regulator with XRE-family HTH domain